MATAVVPGYDATHSNISSLPRGKVAAGYTTGSWDIVWTNQDWATHPGAVRIDQDARASDGTADVLDVENGAATIAEVGRWARTALECWHTDVRPGQRLPAIYCNEFNITPAVNALIASGITSGVGLWPANWNYSYEQAAAIVEASGGPFPIIGIQYNNAGAIDDDVFAVHWLSTISGIVVPVVKPPVPPAKPPAGGWQFPAPPGLRAFSVSSTGYRLAWGAVKGPAGQQPASYEVATYDHTGKEVNSQAVTHLGTSEYGPGGHGLPAGVYKTQVWANGGPVAPEGSTVTVTLRG